MLSVALCSYNGEKFLTQQLESILNQSKAIDEIVICDDNSTDSTINIIEGFINKYPSIIKLYKNPLSLGPIKNFEKAINFCSGDIIFLSDQDDVWKYNKVKSIFNKFINSPLLEAVFTDAELIDDNNVLIGETLWNTLNFDLETQKGWISNTAFKEILYKRNKITGATLAIKRSLFDRAVPFPIINGVWHDAWLGLHAAANQALGLKKTPLIKYRIHSNQQVGIGNGTTLSNKKINLKEFLINIKQHYLDILYIANEFSILYPAIQKKELQQDAIDWINWIDFRLYLSKNIFVRIYNIIKNVKVYRIAGKSFFKTIIRDILSSTS